MRKRKHPYQIMDISQLTVGARYAFVSAYANGDIYARVMVMAGVMSNTIARARRTGWNLVQLRLDGTMISSNIPMSALNPISGSSRLDDLSHVTFSNVHQDGFVTVHQDGWNDTHDNEDRPTLAYWTAQRIWRGWDYANSCLSCSGPEKIITSEHDLIVVLEGFWLADPRIHAACDEAACDESPTDTEQSMRAKMDDNLRHAFGY